MRILNFFVNFFSSRFEGLISSSMTAVIQDLINKSRQALLIVMASIVAAALLIAGIIIAVINASQQYDTKNAIYFTATLTSGLVLAVLSLATLAFLLWPRKKSLIELKKQLAEPPPQAHSSPLEDTLAMVLMEAMNYLKNKAKEDAPDAEEKTPGSEFATAKTHSHFRSDTAN